MFRNDVDAAFERARIAEEQLRRLESKDKASQAELDALRATLEAERGELQRLQRAVAAASAARPPAPRGQQRIVALAVAIGALVSAGVVVFLVVARTPPVRSAGRNAPALPRMAPTLPAPAPPSPAPKALATELPAAEMTRILTGGEWVGLTGGTLVFEQRAGVLAARLVAGGGEQRLQVALGPLATLTLRLSRDVSGVTESYTFHGALAADRAGLQGTFDKTLREGENEYTTHGTWAVRVRPPAER